MDLTAYKNQRIRLNRSRSSSCCSLFRKRVFYQEIYSLGTNTLSRSYSSDEVWDKKNDKLFQTVQVSSFITPQKKAYVSPEEKKPNTPFRLPPARSANEADTTRKNKAEKGPVEKPSELNTTLKRAVIFFLVTSIAAYAVHFYREFRECSKTWDIYKTRSELYEHVYGQNFAISQISSVLKDCSLLNDIYVMVFTGKVGVGKTYASSIIKRNFPWRMQKRIPYSEKFEEDVSTLFDEWGPSTCGCNLIIIDNLTVLQMKVATDFVKLLETVRKNNENFLVILIFQTVIAADKTDILTHFKKFHNNFVHVSFYPLNERAVRLCYKREIEKQGVEIPLVELNRMVWHRMNDTSPEKKASGCKGVSVDVASYLNKSSSHELAKFNEK